MANRKPQSTPAKNRTARQQKKPASSASPKDATIADASAKNAAPRAARATSGAAKPKAAARSKTAGSKTVRDATASSGADAATGAADAKMAGAKTTGAKTTGAKTNRAKATSATSGEFATDRHHIEDSETAAEQLATRFLSLWDRQISATADGADAASAIGRLFAALGADTGRLGEGFEAWGKLIGQMASGEHPGAATMPGAVGGANIGGMGAATAGIENPMAALFPGIFAAMPHLAGGNPFDPTSNPFIAMMARMAEPFAGPGGAGAGNKEAGQADGPEASGVAAPSDRADAEAGADIGQGHTPANTANTENSGNAKPRKSSAETGQDDHDSATQTPRRRPAKAAAKPAGGAASAADASGSRDDEVARLTQRIADLSETIAAMEAGASGGGKKPSGGDGGPSS